MSLWDDKSMAGSDRVAVVNGDGKDVGQDDFEVVRCAEGAAGFIE